MSRCSVPLLRPRPCPLRFEARGRLQRSVQGAWARQVSFYQRPSVLLDIFSSTF